MEINTLHLLAQVSHLLEGLEQDKEVEHLRSQVKALVVICENGNEFLARAGLELISNDIDNLILKIE